MGIKRSTLYYQRKINIHRKQKELRIRKKIVEVSREYPITVIGESPHN